MMKCFFLISVQEMWLLYCSGETERTRRMAAETSRGTVDPSDYTYDACTAEIDGQLVGLLIDENNEADKTELRIQNWTDALKKEI